MDHDDSRDAVERWSRSRGIPRFIEDHRSSRDVFPRALLVGAVNERTLLTDAMYRKELLDHVLVELRQAFAVRAVYPAAGAVSGG